jgi:hypothetical protein
MNPRILFVGAGPVGLMTAIQTKLHYPNLDIIMLEKYTEYKRKHALQLAQSSFADAHPDEEFQKLIHSLDRDIRTNELEDKLLVFAKNLNIKIDYTAVSDCNKLIEQYPDVNIIVGADGSHSIVHQQVFNHQYQLQKTMQYIVELKYEVEGKARPLNIFTEIGPTKSFSKHYVSEYVGHEKQGKTPLAIRIFVDHATYESMKEATFKSPYNLEKIDQIKEDNNHLAALNKSIQAWLLARRNLANENRIEGSERITITNLPIYASEHFVKESMGRTWFLVGDAAFGVPYFRSLNNGILCSSQLAKAINAKLLNLTMENYSMLGSLSSLKKQNEDPLDYYKNFVQHLVNREIFTAEFKNLYVNSMQTSASISQTLPLSKMKLISTHDGRNFIREMEEVEPTSLSSMSIFKKFPGASSRRSHVEAEQESVDIEEERMSSGCNLF